MRKVTIDPSANRKDGTDEGSQIVERRIHGARSDIVAWEENQLRW